jgi:CheY-like chemotaxis protein
VALPAVAHGLIHLGTNNGPLLAGFPLNLFLSRVQMPKSGEALESVNSVYEPATVVGNPERRELSNAPPSDFRLPERQHNLLKFDNNRGIPFLLTKALVRRCQMRIKVLLADDTAIIRKAVRGLLENRSEVEVVGEAANFQETLQMTKDLKPNIVIMDLHMRDEFEFRPLDVKSAFRRSATQLLAVSIWIDADSKALAQSFGAVMLLDKINLGQALIPSIIEFAQHG